MNPYTLAIGLALGEARAEEPKECIDEIAINFQVRSKDRIGQRLRSPAVQQRVSDIMEREFETEVGVRTRIYWDDDITGAATVMYTTIDALRRDTFPTYESLASFIYRNSSGEDHAKWEQSEKLLATLPLQEQEAVKRELYDSFVNGFKNTAGLIDREARISYIIEPLISQDPVGTSFLRESDIISIITRNAIHEIGHILIGGGHAEQETLPNGEINVMYKGVRMDSLPAILIGAYSFSDQDKAKIQQQMCKPEEPK